MQCSPSFDWNWGKQNDPTACWHQLHLQFQVLQQAKCLRYPPERIGVITETTKLWVARGLSPLPTPIKGGTPPLKFPYTHYLGQWAAEKPSTFLAIFIGLSMTQIASIWSAL